MNFIGIDLHTNRFTCCYRDEEPAAENSAKGKAIKTFELNESGLTYFYQTLTPDTYVLAEAAITTFSFVRLFQDKVKEVIIANTYELKQISPARRNTDKSDFSPQTRTNYAACSKRKYCRVNNWRRPWSCRLKTYRI